MKCSELCWHVLSSNPPMQTEYDNVRDQPVDSNKFNKCNRTGIIDEYVVWPALLLHKDGPVLAKGTVQTNYEDKTTARKKSSEDIFAPLGKNLRKHICTTRKKSSEDMFAPPKTCKPTTPTGNNDVTVPAPLVLHTNGTHFSNEIDFHKSGCDLKNYDPRKTDHPIDVSQKEYSKIVNQLYTSKENKSNGDSIEKVPANTDDSDMCITDTNKFLPLHYGSLNQSGMNTDLKLGSSLKTEDAEKINQTFRSLEENGESNSDTINDQLIEGNPKVSAEGFEGIQQFHYR
ncbi:unnamed protein product [Mytilus coruscus]|uniref:Uncharacterized protein n=1 Tax=Mytilus coruscus TaxID=42192 RepID=A0A6J8B096_MYTCO|nr:unnamed protein product [Mytilus coruscus]